MDSDFNIIIGQAIKRARTSPTGTVEEFAIMASSAEEQLAKIYQENPDATKEEVNRKMQEKLEKILETTAQILDFKSDMIRRNTIRYVNSNPNIIEQEYKKIVAEEIKTGKQVKNKERILYSSNRKQSIRQLMVEVISNIREIVAGANPELVNILKTGYNGKLENLKRLFDKNNGRREQRERIERTIYLAGPISELEKVKFYFTKMISQEKTDKDLKEGYVEAISIIGQSLKDLGLIDKYNEQENRELSRLRLEKLQDEDGINRIFEKESLQKMSLPQLSAMYAFWDNRLEKEIEQIYYSYFIMYELNLDDRETVTKRESASKVSQEKLDALNIKTSLLNMILSRIYFDYRNSHLDGGKINIENVLQRISDKIGKDYQRYFSGIGELDTQENNFDKDSMLHLRLENSIRNLYLQKDNGIIGLLDLLYNGEVSENWGIIDDNPNSKFVLLSADINGLNMPLRLHISRDLIKEFVMNNQENAIVPLYSGKDDFIINGRYMGTHILMSLTQKQKDAIKQATSKVKEDDCRYKFIKHLEFLADGQKFPEHLQQKRVTKKKGKTKVKFEKVMQYIDLDTGKKYIKTKDGQFIPNDGEDGR